MFQRITNLKNYRILLDKHFYKQKKKQNATTMNVTRNEEMKHFLHSTMRQSYTSN